MSPAADRMLRAHPDWLRPEWAGHGVTAVMTTRRGGVSKPPFDRMNLRFATGDDRASVERNQAFLDDALGVPAVYLNQVHGACVVRLTAADAMPAAAPHDADGSVTTDPRIACAVQVADCLPVLFKAPGAVAVGAAHAGWRGLALGVLEATLAALCDAASCDPGEVDAWLGACIGPRRFEVGADVLAAFGRDPADPAPGRFVPYRHPGSSLTPKWLADLPGLASDRLRAAGVTRLSGGAWCTVEDRSRFFSFRRDRVTGRMAAAVCIGAGADAGLASRFDDGAGGHRVV